MVTGNESQPNGAHSAVAARKVAAVPAHENA